MPKKRVLIIEPDKLNEEVLQTYLNIRNGHADRIEDDSDVILEGIKHSGLCFKKANKLIKGEDSEKLKKAIFTVNLTPMAAPSAWPA